VGVRVTTGTGAGLGAGGAAARAVGVAEAAGAGPSIRSTIEGGGGPPSGSAGAEGVDETVCARIRIASSRGLENDSKSARPKTKPAVSDSFDAEAAAAYRMRDWPTA
jgi:hypothetical protein